MKKCLIALMLALLCLALTSFATAESGFTPVPWDVKTMPQGPHKSGYLPDNAGYHDDSIDVRIETFRRDDTTVMAVYVTIADPSQLRTATAANKYPSKATAPVTAMLKKANGVIGINGDYFAYHSQGIVVRNGRQLRNKPNKGRDTLIIDQDANFTILQGTTKEMFEAFEGEVIQAFCFGPGLVVDGVPLTDLDTVTMDCGKGRKTQRIVIGQIAPLQYVLITCEGPENEGSVGFDLLQMAQLCKELGCVNAYNLDGGSSCTVALNGKKINAISSRKVRYVSDIIYFATLDAEE